MKMMVTLNSLIHFHANMFDSSRRLLTDYKSAVRRWWQNGSHRTNQAKAQVRTRLH